MILKRLLYNTLGSEGYLQTMSRGFFWSFKRGRLKGKPWYINHYYVDQLVKPGDHVLDIGANLGYYSVIFAEVVGDSGKVWSVEPVPLYQKVFRQNTKKFPQVELIPFALGLEEKSIQMGIPGGHAYFRHGLTEVAQDNEQYEHTFTAQMKPVEELFGHFERLDYVKCDIEGYETVVIPAMKEIFEKHRPILQLETGQETRAQMLSCMQDLGYQAFFLDDTQLVEVHSADQKTVGDLYFIYKS